MDAEQSITRLIGLARDGRADAAEHLWAAYFHKLVAIARNKLDATPRAADAEDMALSAFHSFWTGVRGDRFPHLADRTSLWPLLVAITLNKCVDHVRRQTRQKRGGGMGVVGLDQLVAREPGPDLDCEVADTLAHLLGCLDRHGDPSLRKVAELRLHGHAPAEIAEQLDCSRRTVERKLALIEECWATEATDDPDA